MKKLIITRAQSDLSDLISRICDCDILSPAEAEKAALSAYSGIAVLGGTERDALMLNPFLRSSLEKYADSGKPLFLEYLHSFRCVYSAQPVRITCDRLVSAMEYGSISENSLLDSHYNLYIRPHFLMPETEILLYYQKYTTAHDTLDNLSETDRPALFKYGNVMHCAFCMSDFLKAAFAPWERWCDLVSYILSFLGITPPEQYEKGALRIPDSVPEGLGEMLDSCTSRAITLLRNYLITPDGVYGIREGLSHNIAPNGSRTLAGYVRADCCGEAAGVFLFSGDDGLAKIADNLLSLCYGPLTIHEGDFKGMMRWTEEAWNVCYQDDVARAVLSSLLASYFGISDKYSAPACDALEFLCKTSAKDGLRPARTDILEFLRENKSPLTIAETESGYASAHYNAYYSAALLLGYLVNGNEDFKTVGIRGLETLMRLYPETVREHSETSELCRLILPLAILYKVSGEDRHKEMLYRVFNDLQKYRHKSGGYAEWDSGYKAACFNNAGGECSLLAKNGDPVADLLYSVNWLPLGFIFAYHVTEDTAFYNAFADICRFFAKTQIVSENPLIDGAWCRGIDLNRLEPYGIPHDVGWGPCCIETGWTVAEIALGMLIGKKLFKNK